MKTVLLTKKILIAFALANLAAPLLAMDCPAPQPAITQPAQAGMPDLRPGATPRQVMGLPETATVDEAKRTYRVLSLVYNPAKFQLNKAVWAKLGITNQEDAKVAFAKITEAWNKINK